MKVIFYDVEQGSCCHIITPNDKHILVDVGSKAGDSIVEYIWRTYCRYDLDGLVITHPHADHIFDLPNLYKLLKPTVLVRNPAAFDVVPDVKNYVHQQIARIANEMNKTYTTPAWGEMNPFNENMNGGVKFTFIWPKDEWATKNDLNTFSCIIIMKYYDIKFVLTGDNPKEILQKMVNENYENIRSKIRNANVLLAPHHGRENGYCEDFFKLVNPELTVVSDKSIVYGSQQNTTTLYKGRGKLVGGQQRYVLTTRNDGTISFNFDYWNCSVRLNSEGY